MDFAKLASDEYFSFGLCNDSVLYLVKFSQLLVFAELLLVELQPFASHFEEVEDAHLVDELSGVVRIEENVLSKFASLQILSDELGFLLLVPILLSIFFLLDLGGLVERAAVLEGDGEVYLFVE